MIESRGGLQEWHSQRSRVSGAFQATPPHVTLAMSSTRWWCCACLMLSLAVYAQSDPEGQRDLVMGNRHYARGELEEARASYASCLAAAPVSSTLVVSTSGVLSIDAACLIDRVLCTIGPNGLYHQPGERARRPGVDRGGGAALPACPRGRCDQRRRVLQPGALTPGSESNRRVKIWDRQNWGILDTWAAVR